MFFVYPQTQLTIGIRLLFFKMQIFRIHVNSWFILYRSAKVALRLIQKLCRDKQSKMYLKFTVFVPLLPPYLNFSKFYF